MISRHPSPTARLALHASVWSVCFFSALPATSQNIVKGWDAGLHIRGTYGQTDLDDRGLAPLVQPFVRHQLGWNTQGELSAGLGTLSGLDYTTRIIPVDYRVLYYPFSYGADFLLPGIHPGDVYLYAGAGAIQFSHVEIPRPDDPLTVDAGPKIRNTALWDFSENWTFQIPMGIGTAIHLDPQTQLILNAGYHLTTSRRLESFKGTGLDGFLAVSFGFKFNRPVRFNRIPMARAASLPTPAPTLALPMVPEPSVIPAAKIRLEPMPERLLFDVLDTRIGPEASDALRIVQSHLEAKPEVGVLLSGHADLTGMARLNMDLAYERAWQAKVWLLRTGIPNDRIRIQGYGSDLPAMMGSGPEQLRLNRRVEVNLADSTWQTATIASMSAGRPGTARIHVTDDVLPIRIDGFGGQEVDLNAPDREPLDRLAAWMNENTDIRIRITGHSDNRFSEPVNRFYAQVRASRIAEHLVGRGVRIDQILMDHMGSEEPLRSNTTEANRRLNRRVEIQRIP